MCLFNVGSGKINFDGFCAIASHFLEEEDAEAMQQELKEAFRFVIEILYYYYLYK